MSDLFKGKTKREIMIKTRQDSGSEPDIYDYSKDIPFKINLTLKNKAHAYTFLSRIFDKDDVITFNAGINLTEEIANKETIGNIASTGLPIIINTAQTDVIATKADTSKKSLGIAVIIALKKLIFSIISVVLKNLFKKKFSLFKILISLIPPRI